MPTLTGAGSWRQVFHLNMREFCQEAGAAFADSGQTKFLAEGSSDASLAPTLLTMKSKANCTITDRFSLQWTINANILPCVYNIISATKRELDVSWHLWPVDVLWQLLISTTLSLSVGWPGTGQLLPGSPRSPASPAASAAHRRTQVDHKQYETSAWARNGVFEAIKASKPSK